MSITLKNTIYQKTSPTTIDYIKFFYSKFLENYILALLYKTIILKTSLCSILILLGNILWSQDYHSLTLTTENGLPSDKIYFAFEDSKGYIWIGTKNGVARWDSKNFEYFTLKDGLPNNEVTSIQEDSEGRIWFSSFNKSISYSTSQI